jgi:hypothetical protein
VGASGIHYAVDLSTEGKPTAHKSRDHQQESSPRKEMEEYRRDTTYFSWLNRSTRARR